MNVNKLFAKLNEKGITDIEYRYASSSSFSCSVFRHELSNYSASTSTIINVDAVINHKLAMVTSENTSNSNIDNIVNQLFEAAKYTTKAEGEIYKEKNKYRHYNHFNNELVNVPHQKKIDYLFIIEEKLKALDKRIEEVETGYEENFNQSLFQNSAGIRLKNKRNSYSFYASVVINDNNEKKTEFLVFTDNDFTKFNVDIFVKELYEKTIKRLNPISIETKKYKVIFDPEVVDTLIDYYIGQLSAEAILKNSSWFKDKLNTQVANKRVTILETPLKRDHDFVNADVQGVPCQNKALIKKGVLLTYLHNLETARKFNVTPTGNAAIVASKIGIRPGPIHLKPGRLTKEELITKVKNGVYVTSLEGLHAGMNAQSGDFSLKAEGFVIKDGKIDRFIDMMTITSNLFEIFSKVKTVSKNIEYIKTGVYAPCIYLDNVSIAS